jgi:hypothetical protein
MFMLICGFEKLIFEVALSSGGLSQAQTPTQRPKTSSEQGCLRHLNHRRSISPDSACLIVANMPKTRFVRLKIPDTIPHHSGKFRQITSKK